MYSVKFDKKLRGDYIMRINIDDELLLKIDEYASRHFVNRTSAICMLISNSLIADDNSHQLDDLKKFILNLQKNND